jgi:phage terminase small subunit
MTLTHKQQRFVDEYLIDLNATQAAIRAGYSARNADKIGHQLLGKTRVSDEISLGMKAREKRTGITQDRVLQELARIAFFDIRKLYKDDGSLKRPDELDDDAAAVLSGVDVMEMSGNDGPVTLTKKAKVFDKTAALTLAMRHLGMLKDKTEISGPNGGPIQTESRKLQDMTDDELLALATGRGEGAPHPAQGSQ